MLTKYPLLSMTLPFLAPFELLNTQLSTKRNHTLLFAPLLLHGLAQWIRQHSQVFIACLSDPVVAAWTYPRDAIPLSVRSGVLISIVVLFDVFLFS